MKRLAVAAFLAAVPAALFSGPAVASCAAPPPMAQAIDDAHAVFVGTVVDTSDGDRWATVRVSEVWRGDVAERVEVRGGPADPPGPLEAASSVDRTYREGEAYLFLPFGADGNKVFHDNSCSSTTPYGDGFERFRPRGAAPPAPGPAPPDDVSFSPWWGAIAVAVVVAQVWAWRRRATAQ
jgi:hypothetical protein